MLNGAVFTVVKLVSAPVYYAFNVTMNETAIDKKFADALALIRQNIK